MVQLAACYAVMLLLVAGVTTAHAAPKSNTPMPATKSPMPATTSPMPATTSPMPANASTSRNTTFVATAQLSGAKSLPPIPTPAVAAATVIITPSGNATLSLTIAGPVMDVTMAHLHLGSAYTSGPVVLGVLPQIAGPPLQMLSPPITVGGSVSLTISFTEADLQSWNATGNSTLNFSAFIDLVKKELIYVNIHTTQYGAGIIRGQLQPLY